MKKRMTLKVCILLSILGSIVSCTQAPKSDEAKVGEAQKIETTAPKATNTQNAKVRNLKVDTQNSIVSWIGTKPVKRHNGTIAVQSGNLVAQGNNITGGEFVMDMKKVRVLDMDEENNNNLAGHLMSEDFFKSEQYPTAKFVINKVVPYAPINGEKSLLSGATHNVTGNFTLLGTTKSITFPAKVSISDNGVKAEANFNIDRTNWGVSYGNDQSLGNKFIKPTVNIGINLTAN